MQHENDLSGLREYLTDKKKMKQQDILTLDGASANNQEMAATTAHDPNALPIPIM